MTADKLGTRARATTRRARLAAAEHDAAALAVQALEAFEQGAALIDLTHQRLLWCSPGFSSRCCVESGDSVLELELHLQGVAQALTQLGQPPAYALSDAPSQAPRPRWRVVDGDDVRVAEASHVRPGVAAVRLLGVEAAPAPTLAQAAARGGVAKSLVGVPAPDAESLPNVVKPSVSQDSREQAARRHLEDREKLLFTSRALAVGEMASTLAHELNQPIGTVANVLRGLRLRLEKAQVEGGDMLLSGVQLALEQSLFAARIIARIREYTHSRQPRREALALDRVLRESLALLDWELQRDGVELVLQLPDAACPVLGDEVMLQQLFVNLLRNALEAMRDNPPDVEGRATRRLKLVLALSNERNLKQAWLTVRDNGCGLPQDASNQLFVPFQSTKPNGMGIGLNICRSFVELHQGRLWFTPNDDGPSERGCTFHVALPLHDVAPPTGVNV
jgi:two-component system, LuxR family, sensor kinase FixL